jgi:Protein kinase domain/AAA ATPase domain
MSDDGRTIQGRYRIEEEIGRGAMGSVYRVCDGSTQRRLALKTLRPSEHRDARRDRAELWFRREFHVVAGLRHPCIVEVHDYGIDGQTPYYTMELLDGHDLRDHPRFEVEHGCRVLREVASALAFLHARRLVHRDLKPRNVRCTSRGRAKLIDFGILASMGVIGDVAGTPPSMAPESVRGLPLDGRADLFGLGTLAYWMFTGRQAYPVRTVEELEQAWRSEPPSLRHGRDDIPIALDELVRQLIALDAAARPGSAAEVIDRLDAICGLAPDHEIEVARAWLLSGALVGRDAELEQLRRDIDGVGHGAGAAILIEAPSGVGKSRLLREAGWYGQLAGALVLRARAELAAFEPYAVVRQLVRQLFAQDPLLAERTAHEHISLVGRILPLPGGSSDSWPWSPGAHEHDPAEQRLRLQVDVLRYFDEVARARPLVLLVDELHHCDEASAAFLAALAHQCEASAVVIVAALRTDAPVLALPAIAALRELSARISLQGLDPTGVRELVGALFGELVGADRIAAWLHQVARGNPMHTMELVRGLVDRGIVRYAEGMWMAGAELEAGAVASQLSETMRTRVDELPSEARALAELFAVFGTRVPLPWCVAGADVTEQDTVFAAIDRLIFEQVLQGDDRGLELRHDGLREALLQGMTPARRRELHGRCASILDASEGPRPELEARLGRHWLESGEADRGAELLERAGRRLYDAQSFFDALAPLEAALTVLRERPHARLRVTDLQQLLMRAGVLVDRHTVLRHADAALAAMDADSGLPLARRLAPWLGGKLALALGLSVAFVAWLPRRRTHERPLRALVRMLALTSYAASVHSLALVTDRVHALLERLSPLRTIYGRVPRGAWLLIETFELIAIGHWRRLEHNLVEILELLAADRRTPLAEIDRRLALGACHYMRASVRALAVDPDYRASIAVLDELDLRFFSVASRVAPVFFHRLRGEEELAREHVARAEVGLVQLGNAWVFSTQLGWISAIAYGLTQDVLGLKRVTEDLERSVADGYELAPFLALARGEYARARGDTGGAIELLDDALRDVPAGHDLSRIVLEAALVDALVEHGDARRALALADGARARVSSIDEPFVIHVLRIDRGRALALAACGELDAAAVELERLIVVARATHSPLASGSMHEAAAVIARAQGDGEACRRHAEQAERYFAATGNPALLARSRRLFERTELSAGDGTGGDELTVQLGSSPSLAPDDSETDAST